MSAIFGLVAFGGANADRERIAPMGAALADAGRGDATVWAEGPAALGHRLTCFTPEDRFERQPLVSRAREFVLAFDGRIDNRGELVRQLAIAADEPARLPDSALVMRACERWGPGCHDRLVGDFAFALWDPRTGALTLVRSALCGRPLFVHVSRDAVVFASRPRGLFALPQVRRVVDEARLVAYLAMVRPEPNASFHRDVKRVEPGETMTIDRSGSITSTRWQPDLDRRLVLRHDDDYVAAFRELLDRVVGDHLRSSAPVAISMSGGLDSSAVAVHAAGRLRSHGRRLLAYTEVPAAGAQPLVPPRRYADETPFAQAIAEMHPTIDLRLVTPETGDLLRDDERFFATAEMPIRNAVNRGWVEAINERAAGAGAGVLLTGDHGNLTASWDGRGLMADLLRERRLRRAVAEARASARAGRARSTPSALVRHGVMPLLGRGPASSPWEQYALIDPGCAAEHRIAERVADRERTTDLRALRVRVMLALSFGFDMSAGFSDRFGVEMRAPLADRRIVEFCLALPEDQYARGGRKRLLIRRAMAGRLPALVLDNPRQGLQAADWYARMSHERERLLGRVAELEGDELCGRVLDLPRLRRLLEHWPADASAAADASRLLRGAVPAALNAGGFCLWAQRN